jgi:hypothetical protein
VKMRRRLALPRTRRYKILGLMLALGTHPHGTSGPHAFPHQLFLILGSKDVQPSQVPHALRRRSESYER